MLGMSADGADPPALDAPVIEATPVAEPEPVETVEAEQTSTVEDRLVYLSESAGVTIPVVYGNCHDLEITLACFMIDYDTIVVTDRGLAQDDARLKCILEHENRHYYQKQNNLIRFATDGTVSNRAWLEQDAETNGCKHNG